MRKHIAVVNGRDRGVYDDGYIYTGWTVVIIFENLPSFLIKRKEKLKDLE